MVLSQNKHMKERRLPERLQLKFLEQLAQLLSHGYTLLESLERIKWDKRMSHTAMILMRALKTGLTIDQAFTQAQFHYSITSYLYFVRKHGNLLASILTCKEMFAKRLRYKQTFQQIMRYPLFLGVIFSIILIFLRQAILPTFLNIFQTNNQVPKSLMYIFVTLDYVIPLFIFMIGSLCIGIITVTRLRRKIDIQVKVKIYERIPIYRRYLQRQTSFQIATHLSELLKTGMPLKDILHHMSKQDRFPIVAYYTKMMLDTLNMGNQISQLLVQCYFIEQQMTDIFQNNYDNQSLAKDLAVYSNMLADRMHQKIITFLQIIQPIFFVIIGIFIVLVYFMLMWPMFQLINQL